MLCWLCIVQSLWAYTPGILAGAECGAAALTPLGATPQTPFLKDIKVFNKLYSIKIQNERTECNAYKFLIRAERNTLIAHAALCGKTGLVSCLQCRNVLLSVLYYALFRRVFMRKSG